MTAADTVKRVLDLCTASLALILASPVLALCAAAIKLEDGGPVIFRQERVGRGEQLFQLYKLRSMVLGAEAGEPWVAADDPRVTRVGRILRIASLDELPQLVNVLKGEMSLVGPRPTLAYQVAQYADGQRRRLEVRPGITGWAQVHGRNTRPWAERIKLDVWYVDHRSTWLDVRILAMTMIKTLRGDGVHGPTGQVRTGNTSEERP